jgi:multiple sugar transport system substrate-binding protein
VWAHQGQEGENRALRQIAAEFTRAVLHPHSSLELTFFPDHHYTERLSIAAAAEDLPDAFELDGPLVTRFVDAGRLAPLTQLFTAEEQADFLPTIVAQGSVDGQLYTLGSYDSAAVLYCDRSLLDAVGAQYTHGGRGFSWSELLDTCERLAARGIVPLAMHTSAAADEWFTYAFTPLLWSGGGQLIDARPGGGVRGVLASPENVAALRAWQGLFVRGFALADAMDPDPFGNGAAAMDWSGHWMARSHLRSKGAALGVMGLPRLGPRPVAACGSFCWALSSRAAQPERAVQWLRWVTDAVHGVAPLVRANGAVPARLSAFAAFPEYERLPYRLFREQLESFARPRPHTPFYATLTQKLAAAMRDIAHGADAGTRLRRAEDEVQGFIDRWRGTLQVPA